MWRQLSPLNALGRRPMVRGYVASRQHEMFRSFHKGGVPMTAEMFQRIVRVLGFAIP